MTRLQLALCAAAALLLHSCGQANPPGPPPAEPATSAEQLEGTEFCEEIGRRVSPQDCEDLARLAGGARAGVAAFNAPDPMQRGEVHTLQLAIGYAPPAPPANGPVESNDVMRALEAQQEYAAFVAAREANTAASYDAYLSAYPNGRYAAIAREAIDNIAHYVPPGDPRAPDTPPPPPLPPPPDLSATSTSPGDVVGSLQGETVEFAPLVGRFMRAELSGAGFEITPISPASQEVLPDSVTTWSWRVVAQEGGVRPLTLTTVVEGCTAANQCYPLRSTSQNYEVNVTVGWLGKAQDVLTAMPNWLRLIAGVLAALTVLVGAWFGLRNAFRKGRSGG